jgi:hypothetical protein
MGVGKNSFFYSVLTALRRFFFPLGLACFLFVGMAGNPCSAATIVAAPIAIDWSKDWAQETAASCGDFSLKNLKDHHSYTLYVRGTAVGTCSFHADGLTFRMPPNHGQTMAGTTTFYAFERFGPDVLVTWVPGY